MTAELTVQPFFLDGSAGRLFALYMAPAAQPNPERGVLLFPPFAEELNKSRRMAVLQARRLAERGCAVLLFDLYGTGDSAGEFRQARWRIWVADTACAAAWLTARGVSRLAFCGLRLGVLLALASAPAVAVLERIVAWQPATRGATVVNQFLRVRTAAEMMGGARVTSADLRRDLAQNQVLEVAGYELHAELVRELDTLEFTSLARLSSAPIDWLEVAQNTERGPSAQARRIGAALAEPARPFHVEVVAGQAFWSTPEITTAPALLDRTTTLLTGNRA